MAGLEADRLVADTGGRGVLAPAQRPAPDAPIALNGDVANPFAPDEAVVVVAVAEILVHVPLVGLGHVEPAAALCGRVGRNDGRPGIQVQRDIVLEADGIAQVIAGREHDCSAARGAGRFNGLVDGWRVERFAVARGAKRSHIEGAGDRGVGGGVGDSLPCLKGQASSGQPGAGALEKLST